MSLVHTPDDLAIHPRDLSFARRAEVPRHWLGGDPVGTAFFNALSASFPIGERFFIDAVRRFRDCGDARLKKQIEEFIAQESVHTREHLLFNVTILNGGYDLSTIDRFLKAVIGWARTRPPLQQLAGTIALEHFTAILAHAALTDRSHLAGAPPAIEQMWRWHAIEEIEHKSVAFDAFLAATHDKSGFARWHLRSWVMIAATIQLLSEIVVGVREFFRQDGINTWHTWLAFLRYLFVKPGMFRQVAGRYFAYYRPGFHPWQVDDRSLIAEVERELGRAYATA